LPDLIASSCDVVVLLLFNLFFIVSILQPLRSDLACFLAVPPTSEQMSYLSLTLRSASSMRVQQTII
jgi:hypothetical protein